MGLISNLSGQNLGAFKCIPWIKLPKYTYTFLHLPTPSQNYNLSMRFRRSVFKLNIGLAFDLVIYFLVENYKKLLGHMYYYYIVTSPMYSK